MRSIRHRRDENNRIQGLEKSHTKASLRVTWGTKVDPAADSDLPLAHPAPIHHGYSAAVIKSMQPTSNHTL